MGKTALHIAARFCSVRLLSSMISAGGDMRLHDDRGRSVADWVLKGTDDKKKKQMDEFLRKIELLAMAHRDGVEDGVYNSFNRFQRYL